MTAGFTRYTPAVSGARWTFVVGTSFVAMLPSESSAEVVDALWWHALQEHATIEALVGTLPLVGDSAVRSFGVVSLGTFAGEEATTVTAVVRGTVAIDLFSVGGARRFSAEGVQPWVLADFRSVTGFALDSEDARGDNTVDVTRGSLPVAIGVVEGSVAVWSARVTAIPIAKPPRLVGVPGGGIAGGGIGSGAGSNSGGGGGGNGLPSQAASKRAADDSDETIIRARTVTTSGSVAHDGTAAADGLLGQRTVEPHVPGGRTGSSGAILLGEHESVTETRANPSAPLEPLEPLVPRVQRSFQIRGTADRYPLDVPAYIGRRPRAALAPSGPDPRLVSVRSPEQLVSSTHLHIQQVGDTVVVTDLGSTNGTRLLGMEGRRSRLRPGESRVVLPGSAIDIGDGNIIEITPDD